MENYVPWKLGKSGQSSYDLRTGQVAYQITVYR